MGNVFSWATLTPYCMMHIDVNLDIKMYLQYVVVHKMSFVNKFTLGSLSYSTIIVYNRDHKGVGMAHEITSPKHQPQFSLTMMRKYWLGKTKPQQAFRST